MSPMTLQVDSASVQCDFATAQDASAYVVAQSEDMLAIEQTVREVWDTLSEARPVPPPFDVLPGDIGAKVAARWNEPCEGVFEYLAAKHPMALAVLIRGGTLKTADLTFAAEYMGQAHNSPLVRSVLLPLLEHPNAVVREGAIYGIRRHSNTEVRALLISIREKDPNLALREAAMEALEDL